MKNGLVTGIIAGLGAGVVAGMMLMPYVSPKIKQAVNAGKKAIECKMRHLEDEF